MLGSLFIHMIGSFLSSTTFGVLCNVPRTSIVMGGFIGMIGWMGYWGLSTNGMGLFLSSLCCSLLLALIGQITAYKCKMPFTVYFVPGIVPVVPGITLYEAFRLLLLQEYEKSFFVFLDVGYCAIGITCGLIIASIIFKFTLTSFLK